MFKQSPTPQRTNVPAVCPKLERVPIEDPTPSPTILRKHSAAKMRTLLASLSKNGLINPIIINGDSGIVDGHARVTAARQLGWTEISAIRVEHLTDEDLRLFAIAANKLPADAAWDMDALRRELEAIEISVPQIDLTLSGFSIPEIDTMRGAYAATLLSDLIDDIPGPPEPAKVVSQPGDVWILKDHRLICGDATDPTVLAELMGDDRADQLFTDPPYNVSINGHLSNNGKARHREFAMASGEMSERSFVSFLKASLGVAVAYLADGALAYVCMDHAHIGELLEAGAEVFTERKVICVWDKGTAGMGSLYRSVHELVVVFKNGTAPHVNNIMLGRNGRNRTTVWRYPGVGQQGKGRAKALSLHPTVKPVALVADAILDTTPRGGIVLDLFGGSGTTMIAAERTGRRARMVELDPIYVDTILVRFETLTGVSAIHAATGLNLADLRKQRLKAATEAHADVAEEGARNG